MKRVIFLIGMLLVGFLTMGSLAQTPTASIVKWHIPFSFAVGGTNMPAGEYTVRHANPFSPKGPMVMKSNDGKHVAYFDAGLIEMDTKSTSPRLIFAVKPDQYSLCQVLGIPGIPALNIIAKKDAKKTSGDSKQAEGERTIILAAMAKN